jgi:TonB family protein
MSRVRGVGCASIVAVMLGSSGGGSASAMQQTPAPAAAPAGAEARRPLQVVHRVPVEVPSGLHPELKKVEVQLDAAVAADGAVAGVRLIAVQVIGPKVELAVDPDVLRKEFDAMVKASSDSVRQWRFEAPATAPASVRVPSRFDIAGGHAAIGSIKPQAGYPPSVIAVPPGDALRVGGAVATPKKIVNVPPAYPQAAMDAKVQGAVVLQVTLDPGGVPTDVEVVESIPALDAAAIEAVRQWRYEPTLMNGEPVPVAMLVTLTFSLEQR